MSILLETLDILAANISRFTVLVALIYLLPFSPSLLNKNWLYSFASTQWQGHMT